MDYQVFYGPTPIGDTNLEYTDPTMGVAHGPFSPSSSYGAVRDVFRLFTRAIRSPTEQQRATELEQYYNARDRLGLTLRQRDGTPVPTSAIHIIDPTDDTDIGDRRLEGYYIEVVIPDSTFFQGDRTGNRSI
jgi:hypothetical protein